MKSGGDPNVTGPRERREVMIDDQPGTSETIPATPEAAASRPQGDFFSFAEPELAKSQISEPGSEPSRSLGDKLSSFFSNLRHPLRWWRNRPAAVSTTFSTSASTQTDSDRPITKDVPTVGNDSISVRTSGYIGSRDYPVVGGHSQITLNARNPYDLAGMLQKIESEFTPAYRQGDFVEVLTTFPQQPFEIGRQLRAVPNYNTLTQFSIIIERLNNEVPMGMVYKAAVDFESQRYREIVERVDTVDSNSSLGETLFSLFILRNILAAESRRIADMLHIDVNSNDPRLNQLRFIGQLFAGSLPSNLAVGRSVRILEMGIRQNSKGEYNAIVVKFAKGGTSLRDIVTWVGKIQSTGKIVWHYDEVVEDPAHVTNATSPVFLATKEIVKYLVPVANWENVRYSVRLESGADVGGQTPQGPAAPASPATPSTVTGLVETEGEVSSGGHQGSAERHARLAVRMARAVYRHLPQNPWAAVQRRLAVTPFAARVPVPVSIR